jgi:phospho-N-acetylmuramoyl-pentapeptide-transferase
MIIDIVKVFTASSAAFIVGMLITPAVTHYLYKYKAWKKSNVAVATDGRSAEISQRLHNDEEKKTPRMGGVVVWGSAFITIIVIWLVSKIFPTNITTKLDFLSRDQTWIPLFTLVAGSLVGMVDDIMEVIGNSARKAGGLSSKKRLFVVGLISLFVAWWFFAKLGVTSVGFPFLENINLGFWFIPFFIFVALCVYAGGVIDGLDGLSGGVFASMFTAYAGIAFYQQQINLAAFCALIVGGILAFLWFNIPPARFYMSETGMMGLTITLTVVAFMTDSLGGGHGVAVLPIIALPLVVTVLSSVIQLSSKKFRGGKKVFLVAPLHHHFEAIGWPAYKVTMRYWIISVVVAIIGVSIALIG